MNELSNSQAVLYRRETMNGVELHPLAGGTAAVYTNRSPAKETPNEDAAAVVPLDEQSGVVVVADGMGGARGGEVASGMVVDTIRTAIKRSANEPGDLREAILDGIETGNRRLCESGLGGGTTLAAVEIRENMVRPFHVGDSVILVVGQRGKVKLQTISHSPVGFAVEAGLLDATDAIHHEDRHIVSNFVGTREMRIEIGSTVRMAPRDTLLVASDGLLDNLHLDEIIDRIRVGPLEKAAARLAGDARHRMTHPAPGQPSKPDDLTIIAFRLKPPKRKKRTRAAAPPTPAATEKGRNGEQAA